MTLQINGRKESVERESLTILELLKEKSVPDPDMVSVQLNGEILERADFNLRKVNEGDDLEFLYFMGGGSYGDSR
jgi:sulfur carrier protein